MATNTYNDITGGGNWNVGALWSQLSTPVDGDDAIITGPNAPDPTVAPISPVTLNSLDTTGCTDPNGFDTTNEDNSGVITSQITIGSGGSLSIGNAASGPSGSQNGHNWCGDASAAATCSIDQNSFVGQTLNGAMICDGATFTNSSEFQQGTCVGSCSFSSGTLMGNGNTPCTVNANATFDGASTLNNGTVNGDATFGLTSGDTSLCGGGNGTVVINGTATFNYATSTASSNVCFFNGPVVMNGSSVFGGGNTNSGITFNGASSLNGTNYLLYVQPGIGNLVWNSTGTISPTALGIQIGVYGSANTFTATMPVTIDFGANDNDGEPANGIYIADDVDFSGSTAQVSAKIGTQLVKVYPAPGGGGGGGAGRQTMGISI